LAALEHAGRPYRIVLETPSLAALRAAVQSGLGITCRTTHFIDEIIPPKEDLPALPDVAYICHVRNNPHPTIARLGDLVLTAALEL
jgi:DNA-binding transcriptional LysR family regulator